MPVLSRTLRFAVRLERLVDLHGHARRQLSVQAGQDRRAFPAGRPVWISPPDFWRTGWLQA